MEAVLRLASGALEMGRERQGLFACLIELPETPIWAFNRAVIFARYPLVFDALPPG
jgi:hypothetical protein